MKQCNHCHQWKEEEEFYWRYRALGIRSNCCKSCKKGQDSDWYGKHKETHKERVKTRLAYKREEAREYVWNYLLAHPCIVCGETDPVVLEFDHLGKKDDAVSRLVQEGASVARIQKEIDRCQILCAYCHRRKTSQERGWFRK